MITRTLPSLERELMESMPGMLTEIPLEQHRVGRAPSCPRSLPGFVFSDEGRRKKLQVPEHGDPKQEIADDSARSHADSGRRSLDQAAVEGYKYGDGAISVEPRALLTPCARRMPTHAFALSRLQEKRR